MTSITSLFEPFDGAVVTPDDPDYETERSSYMATGTPKAIVFPKSTEAVAKALKIAAESGVPLSIRSGGHSGMGHSTNEDGIIIDMKHFSDVSVTDRERGIVRVGSGAVWGDVAHQLHDEGLVISAGDTKSVGVGGLTLGGGIGIMVRKYGLAVDQLVGAEVVTADGQVLRASREENAELFWALRGGGGNFGVVTYLDFAAHRLGDVHFGPVAYKLDDLGRLLKGWRDVTRESPREVTTTLVITPGFGGAPPSAMMLYCFAGEDAAANETALAPFLTLAPVVSQDVARMPYANALQEAHPPAGMVPAVKDGLIRTLSDETIDIITTVYIGATDKMMFLRSLGGAIADHADDDTAFSHRDVEVLLVCAAFLAGDASAETRQAALGFFNEKIAPLCEGAYSNFFSEYDEHDFARMFPAAALERLKKVKMTYDPNNLFSRNYNIAP